MRVVKVQRPLGGNDVSRLLCYEEGKRNMEFIPVDSARGRWVLKRLGHNPKAYFDIDGDVWKRTFARDW